jgi:hypothetical protein
MNKKENFVIRLLKELLKIDNIRDYLVLMLVGGYIFIVAYKCVVKGEEIPIEFYGLVMTAFGYYFRGLTNGLNGNH